MNNSKAGNIIAVLVVIAAALAVIVGILVVIRMRGNGTFLSGPPVTVDDSGAPSDLRGPIPSDIVPVFSDSSSESPEDEEVVVGSGETWFDPAEDRLLTDIEKAQYGYPEDWVVRIRGRITQEGVVYPELIVESRGRDADGDGLSDEKERELGTDPTNPDSDADGLSDSDEVEFHHTDPLSADSDNDGIPDGDEVKK